MAEYIEREAAIKRFNFAVLDCLGMEPTIRAGDIIKALESIPAADVRPVVHGKWIEHNYDPEYLSCDFSCSECNVYLEEYYFCEGQWPGKTDHYFCPNCGADMKGEAE